MITEKGTLPIGVEFEGKVHREFEIRPQLVRDTVEIFEDKENAGRAEKSDTFFSACIMAKRLITLGDIHKEGITPALILEMEQADFNELFAASRRLEERGRSFRGKDTESQEDCPGPSEVGAQP